MATIALTNRCGKPSLSLRERGLKYTVIDTMGTACPSLSLRERGLKLLCNEHALQRFYVALLARAWIEMSPAYKLLSLFATSLSLRERGLKYLYSLGEFDDGKVALLARAWIEMFAKHRYYLCCLVALLARAWIEMRLYKTIYPLVIGRSPCESVD